MRLQIPIQFLKALTYFMKPDTRYDEHGDPYLTRYTLTGTKEGGRRTINHFHKKDADRALHNHPWHDGYSIILSGGYLEERLSTEMPWKTGYFFYWPGMRNDLGKKVFHRVAALTAGDTWTYMKVGPNYDGWGFLTPERGFIPKKQYFQERGIAEKQGSSSDD